MARHSGMQRRSFGHVGSWCGRRWAQNGSALQCAAEEIRADRELVWAAVGQDGLALCHAAAALQAVREVVLAVVTQDHSPLRYAAEEP